MFVYSVKSKKMIIFLAAWVAVVAIMIALFIASSQKKPVVDDSDINYSASNATERATFLSQFGWNIEEDPVEVSEVVIPQEFNDTYEAYNDLQKKQELDLEPYKGARVKKWVYKVNNYPNKPAQSSDIRATLLVYENQVIGGDVSSMEEGGFMQGFIFPDEALNATTSAN